MTMDHKQYEYRIINGYMIVKELEEYGKDGWKLINRYEREYIFMREIQEVKPSIVIKETQKEQTYKVGQKIEFEVGELYGKVKAMITSDFRYSVAITILQSKDNKDVGSTWANRITVNDPNKITEKEMHKITGSITDFKLIKE